MPETRHNFAKLAEDIFPLLPVLIPILSKLDLAIIPDNPDYHARWKERVAFTHHFSGIIIGYALAKGLVQITDIAKAITADQNYVKAEIKRTLSQSKSDKNLNKQNATELLLEKLKNSMTIPIIRD